ncbi:hypothetical protein AB0I49_13515 [Streptomyces sp. NPDC050617]|uniref:hypothetical protein n=1 Tax=Streptomyces sp. NPDC050617 TaxID=3154628 RepID=UPI00343757DB
MTVVVAATALALGGGLATAGPASAAGCALGVICGEVRNHTGAVMSYTLGLGQGDGYCDVWNGKGGGDRHWRHLRCDQESLQPSARKGGWGSGDDVDAFTFNYSGYYVTLDDGDHWYTATRGEWTKIASYQAAICTQLPGEAVFCYVD